LEITEIRISLRDEGKLKAFATVTFDNEFVIRGLRIISSRNGSYHDIAHPINNSARKRIEDAVMEAYENELRTKSDVSRISQNMEIGEP